MGTVRHTSHTLIIIGATKEIYISLGLTVSDVFNKDFAREILAGTGIWTRELTTRFDIAVAFISV